MVTRGRYPAPLTMVGRRDRSDFCDRDCQTFVWWTWAKPF
ncbi:Uncharacterised protein [Vibrio cholerae]|nr:Uncharacterised protein [Vibrio cholerae]CSI91682.1 Uncharacterised protein [Vibrio cholerae]